MEPAARQQQPQQDQPRHKRTCEAVLAARKALLASLVAAEEAAAAKEREAVPAAQLEAGLAQGEGGDTDLSQPCPAKWDAWGEDLDGLPAPSHY